MNFKIVDSCVVGKNIDQQKCEDKVLVLEDFVCVIDGATSKSEKLYNGETGGLIVSKIIEKEFKSIPRNINATNLTRLLTNAVKDYYVKNNLYEYMHSHPVDRFSATLVIYSDYHNEVWMIGDCQCLIGKTTYTNYKILDDIIANTRAFFLEAEIVQGKTINELMQKDIAREYILPLLIKQSFFQNAKIDSIYNYSVIDGFEVNLKDIKIIRVADKSIVLASDGYPKLFDTLEESERYLKNVIKNDPLCIKIYKSTKGLTKNSNSFDDRSYIKIEKL